MSGNGAYEDEMNEVALFQSALRAAVPSQPDPSLGTRLVPRLAEAGRAATVEAGTRPVRRRPRSRRALVTRVGIAIALIPLVLAGLAFAGVTVPSPARSAFDKVGISLPNQPAATSQATPAGQGSSGKNDGGQTTTAKSEAGGKGNSAPAHQHALEQQAKAQGKAVGHTQGKGIGLHGSTPPGQAKEPGPPSQSNAGGNSATHTTTHTTPEHTTPTTPGNGNGNANGNGKGKGS